MEQHQKVSKETFVKLLSQAYQLFTRQHFDAALLAYEQVIAVAPTNVHGYQGKGRALWQLKRYSEALAVFAQADAIVKLSSSLPNAQTEKSSRISPRSKRLSTGKSLQTKRSRSSHTRTTTSVWTIGSTRLPRYR